MGSFSLPKIEFPSFPAVNPNEAISALTKTFSPLNTINQVTSNINSQQSAIESVRANLAQIRQQNQLAMANADFNSVKSYTAGLANTVDVACVMSSVKPAFTPMTPDSLSNPLASDVLASTTGKLTGGDLYDTLIANTGNLVAVAETTGVLPAEYSAAMNNVVTGDISSLTSPENISDLAVMGAGMYVSGLTGGAIPPQVCSTVIENVAGDAVRSGVSSITTGNVSSVIPSVSGSPSSVDTTALVKSTMVEASGSMFEGVISNTITKSVNSISSDQFTNFGSDAAIRLGTSVLTGLNVENNPGSIGGINMADPQPVINGLSLQALQRAATEGNTQLMLEHSAVLLSSNLIPKRTIRPIIESASSVVQQTPMEKQKYNALLALTSETAVEQNTNTIYHRTNMVDGAIANKKDAIINSLGPLGAKVITVTETGWIDRSMCSATESDALLRLTVGDDSVVEKRTFSGTRVSSASTGYTNYYWEDNNQNNGVYNPKYFIIDDCSGAKQYRYIEYFGAEEITPSNAKSFFNRLHCLIDTDKEYERNTPRTA